VVYAPPPPQSSGNVAMAALIGFAAGIAIGAAIDNDPYYYGPWGWGAWGMGWHGGAVVYRRTTWVVPVRPRYPYVRPVPAYRPNRTVVAPRQTNVTVNVNRNKVNVGNQVNVGNRTTNVGSGNVNVDRNRAQQPGRTGAQQQDRSRTQQNVSKGAVDRTPSAASRSPTTRTSTGTGTSKARAPERGHTAAPAGTHKASKSTAMGGYGNGSHAKAASNRGKSSVSKSKGHARRAA
jgi:hypothetical protein